MAITVLVIYGFCLLFIFCYSIIQLNLAINYKKYKIELPQLIESAIPYLDADLPFVTVQLPIYNELYVVERLIDCITKFDYPKDKFEIQILDDSNDETVAIIDAKVAGYKAKGLDISVVRRPTREGYKAGALKYGLEFCKGEFITIFDADFIPNPDFLRKTIPYFNNLKVGVVQTRWEHINPDYSLLTRMQAFGLDAHFSVEQGGRNIEGHFINFNGTAGVWRKTTILDAGGWQSDTITEDLDLSYRAQLKKWEFVYLENVGCPSELPVAMNALKNQQFRWTKGAAECVRKNLWEVIKANNVGFKSKMHATFHLMNSSIFVCIVLLSVLSVPVLFIKNAHPEWDMLFKSASIFLLSSLFLAYFYWTSESRNTKNKVLDFVKFCFLFPMFLSVSMGLSLHNSWAVIQGLVGKKTAFIRTPKFNLKFNKIHENKYLVSSIKPITFIEGALVLYFIFGLFSAFWLKDFGLLIFHFLLAIGYGYVFYYSIKHSLTKRYVDNIDIQKIIVNNSIWEVELTYIPRGINEKPIFNPKPDRIIELGNTEDKTSLLYLNIKNSVGNIKNCLISGVSGGVLLHQDEECYSLKIENDSLFLSLTECFISVNLFDLKIDWNLKSVIGCFYEFYDLESDFLIRDELEIIRVDKKGNVKWSFRGKDIWVSLEGKNEVQILENKIKLLDFEENEYLIDFYGNMCK